MCAHALKKRSGYVRDQEQRREQLLLLSWVRNSQGCGNAVRCYCFSVCWQAFHGQMVLRISKSQTSSCLCKNTFLHHPMSLGSDSLEYSGQISSYQVLVLLLKLSNHFGYKQFGCTKLHPRLSSLWSLCGIWPREKLDLTNICGTIPNLYVVIHSYKGDGKQRFFCHSIISPI